MTEAAWLTSDDPTELIVCLHANPELARAVRKLSLRSARHLVAACAAAADAELGGPEREQIARALARADDALACYQRPAAWAHDHPHVRAGADLSACLPRLLDVQLRPTFPAQAAVLRDVLGNPFRPAAIDPRWRTSTVVDLARSIDEGLARPAGGYVEMAILADALMDAGCDDEQIIRHLRGPGPHVKGCWAVDLLAGNP